jgi:uncharacterized phage protein (TIGR02220 family)
MSKQLPYFQFEPAEYLASDISMCSLAAQGLFVNIESIYWQKNCTLRLEQIEKRFKEPDLIQELISENVIKIKNDLIEINFLKQQHEALTRRKKRLSNAGKKGVQVKADNQTVSKPPLSEAISLDEATLKQPEEKRREEKILKDIDTPPAEAEDENNSSIKNQSTPQEEERKKVAPKKESFDWDGLLKYINKHTGRKFKIINKTVKGSYTARLKEGYTKEMIMGAIENAPKAQNHIENNCRYLTPTFFSRAEKIDMYAENIKSDSEPTVAPKMNV